MNPSFRISSKLPKIGTTIFTVMSALAKEHDAINLSQGFPDFEPDEKLVRAIEKATLAKQNQYAPMAGLLSLREKIAAKTSLLYSHHPNPETEITITAGGTQALFTAILALVKEKDEVIIFSPAYDSYVPAIELAGGIPIFYDLLPPYFQVDWQQVKKLITQRTKLIIINTPHNPTAKVFTAFDMMQLEKILKNTEILLLSDEVYEHIIFDKMEHQSMLRFPNLMERALVVSSFGKTYHTTGWKIGYVIAPDWLTTEFRKVHQFNVFSVNSIAQFAFNEIMNYPELYLELADFYEEKRNYFRKLLSSSRFRLLDCQGSYFQLLDYSKISDWKDIEFTQHLTKEYKIASIPVSVFYNRTNENKLIRLCFAKQNETLERAAENLLKVQ